MDHSECLFAVHVTEHHLCVTVWAHQILGCDYKHRMISRHGHVPNSICTYNPATLNVKMCSCSKMIPSTFNAVNGTYDCLSGWMNSNCTPLTSNHLAPFVGQAHSSFRINGHKWYAAASQRQHLRGAEGDCLVPAPSLRVDVSSAAHLPLISLWRVWMLTVSTESLA